MKRLWNLFWNEKINKMEKRAKIRKIKWSILDYLSGIIPDKANKENAREGIMKELEKTSQMEECEHPGFNNPSTEWWANTHKSTGRTMLLKLQYPGIRRRSFLNTSRDGAERSPFQKSRTRTASGLSAPAGRWADNNFGSWGTTPRSLDVYPQLTAP